MLLTTTAALIATEPPTHWWGLLAGLLVIGVGAWVGGVGRTTRR
jgi:hypothetical protein